MENTASTGTILTSLGEKRRLAQQSKEFNRKDTIFQKLFADQIELKRQQVAEFEANLKGIPITPLQNSIKITNNQVIVNENVKDKENSKANEKLIEQQIEIDRKRQQTIQLLRKCIVLLIIILFMGSIVYQNVFVKH